MRRVPFLVCTSAFDVGNDFDTRRTTSAYIAIPILKPLRIGMAIYAIPILKPDGTSTWEPWEPAGAPKKVACWREGRKAFVPRRALETWVGLMRGTDPNSPRDKGFVRHMEEFINGLIEA